MNKSSRTLYYLQKRASHFSGNIALSALFIALFLVINSSIAADTSKPGDLTATPAKSTEASAALDDASATITEADSFKLKAYLDEKTIKKIAASGKFDEMPQLMLTADIQKVPLRKVLAVLTHETRLKVLIADSVPDDKISAKFDGLSLEEGLKQILKEQNYMLTWVEIPPPAGTKIKNSFMRVTEIRILPKDGESSGSYQLDEVASAIGDDEKQRKSELAKLVNQALKADKAEDRLSALQKFTEKAHETDDEWTDIEPTLRDQDERVRKAALQAMRSLGDPPLESIADMARIDTSPELRSSALSVAVEYNGEHSIPQLKEALNDPDPGVRAQAERLLHQANIISNFVKGTSGSSE